MKVIVLGNMFGDTAGFSEQSVNDIYAQLVKTKDVYPYLIRGLDEVDRMLKRVEFDGIFIVTYGGIGNNGILQEILEKLNVRFNNNGSFTHSVCYNKLKTYEVLDGIKINHPKVLKRPKYPCVLKPISGEGGSGVKFIGKLYDYNENKSDEAYLEEYVSGEEYTVSVYKGVVGSPVLIEPNGKIWAESNPINESLEYEAKDEIKSLIEKDVLAIYEAVQATSGIRIDFRVKDGIPYYFDVNSMPLLNDGGYYLRSLKDFDESMTFEFIIDDMFNDI